MKLITSELRKLFKKYPIKSQDNKLMDSVVLCKYFLSEGDFTWYVTEAEPVQTSGCKEDYKFFGLVIMNGYSEFGYFYLSELETIRSPRFKLSIERDIWIDPGKECLNTLLK